MLCWLGCVYPSDPHIYLCPQGLCMGDGSDPMPSSPWRARGRSHHAHWHQKGSVAADLFPLELSYPFFSGCMCLSDCCCLIPASLCASPSMGSRRAAPLERSSPSASFKAPTLSIQRVWREPGPVSWVAAITCEVPAPGHVCGACSFSAVPEAALPRSLHLAAVICFPEAAWY